MKIGILYICTGTYKQFWKKFYETCEKYFLKDFKKKYFVFTDSDNIEYGGQKNVKIIRIKHEHWPNITLLRFRLFLTEENELRKQDYVFFCNSNLEFLGEVLPHSLLPSKEECLVCYQYWIYRNMPNSSFPYERRKESLAYIPYGYGKYYVQGGFYGGTSKNFIEMARVLNRLTNLSIFNRITPIWHDESFLNKYILDKKIKLIKPYSDNYELLHFRSKHIYKIFQKGK